MTKSPAHQWINIDEHTFSTFLVLGVVGITILLICVWFVLERQTRSRRHLLLSAVSHLRQTSRDLRRRLTRIESHITDYICYMSLDGTQSLALFRRYLSALEYRVQELDDLLRGRDEMSVHTASDLLERKLEELNISLFRVTDGSPLPALFPMDAERYLDGLLQRIGKEISNSSEFRKRQLQMQSPSGTTHSDLLEAGIRAVGGAGRRLTRSFLSPFLRATDEKEEKRNDGAAN